MATQQQRPHEGYDETEEYGDEIVPVSLCAGECIRQVRMFRITDETRIEAETDACRERLPFFSADFNRQMKRAFPDTMLTDCDVGCRCELPEIADDDPMWARKRWVRQPIDEPKVFRISLPSEGGVIGGVCNITVSGAMEKKSILAIGTCD